ncbi:bifunctional 4-hydroxy-2-oxoglutarate aldolase/2-dehydro-3-deoxy-phosphogluconate aldolase [Lichenihabitans sp. Uapishka_5]|uniref:bifunctional 4-hydroxy-2-oxoglutarate aldolase/2-dehydro-3-deoxy-phosphogluconate aldolase n=1 Tax=Lichenihabitans sp. Uapishka_5 TaxID=3037302 RepID=UPI0029E7CF71|nr:bifunctional 4-hydroxy-2-oxoglutarate aldolase/2-dehydro-3-deoxy-phosphogluconate aldolase [Lichenihabitans sp. Uapishka_5]MDX7953323.1 bifunctional 4-hydroxy-2-oxoglutarate aldolase/2-dehydro-3-deoxy-phosphogluconate aldolase [Lichenihabitans sp. Uapishka_5]
MTDHASFSTLLGRNRAIPVVTFATVDDAVPVGRALLEGGVGVIEVTLRTPAGLEALRRLKTECPDMVLGAGTILTPAQAEAAVAAGARFLVSPGHTATLVDCAKAIGVPWMLGATTLSEVMHLRKHGFMVQKFFPAEPAGGLAVLKAIGSVLPDVRFCPTGGISASKAKDYLALSNIIAVGGSWFVPSSGIDLQAVAEAARQAAASLNSAA